MPGAPPGGPPTRSPSALAESGRLGKSRGLVSSIPVEPSLEIFAGLAGRGNVVPVYTQLAADFETPLSAYLKLRDSRHSFLLESAESTEKGGRWSILGSGPRAVFEARDKEITVREGSKTRSFTAPDDVLAALEREMAAYHPVTHGALPPFTGGLVGYLSYDAVRQFEPTIGPPPHACRGSRSSEAIMPSASNASTWRVTTRSSAAAVRASS